VYYLSSKKGLNVNAAVFVLTKSSANPTPSFSGSASADPALLPPTPQQFTQFPSRIHVQPTAIVNTATPLSHLPVCTFACY
jgi:hypothetical protein